MKVACRWISLPLVFLFLSACQSSSKAPYAVILPVEVDSLLSAWAIQRHVESRARFVGIEGSVSNANQTDAIAARYPVGTGLTQFEQIAQAEHLQGACIDSLKEASRVFEIMAWRKNQFPSVLQLEHDLKAGMPERPQPADFERAFVVIDQWCKAQPVT